MHAETETAGSILYGKTDDKTILTEVLIIGFGFSTIPLIRELERDGTNYAVVSSGESIWDKLERHARLDFDMVSSMHTSLYSFELVNRNPQDRYLTSKEFSSFIKKYLSQYSSKVINDLVILVENHPSHSTVRTQSGRVFETKHLVIATAFKRKMNQLLNEFDYASAKNKTIVITAIGDSVNLMISKLVPYNNRIVLVTNGFMCLDKLTFYDGISYTLDQLEYHNVRIISNVLYRKIVASGMEFVVACQKPFKALGININNLYFKHPLALRMLNLSMFFSRSPVPNGIIILKYWPIDSYQTLFDNDSLKQSIRDGYLLNDIAFFLEHRLIELWPKQEAVINREEHTIRWKDNVVRYDCIVDADHEVPNLPNIVVHREGASMRKYEYIYRNNFMGIVPKELNKVYFIGFTRPTTGGLNNIIEMQCLFTHKLIANSGFNRETYDNLDHKIHKYNKYYGPSDASSPTDHLVYYGFYADDLARLMRIGPRLSDCRSIRDLAIYFFFPNTAFKYRQCGPYKVDGVKEMLDRIYKNHKGFSITINYVLGYALLQLTAYVSVFLVYYRQPIYLPVVALPLLLLIVLWNPVTPFIAANGAGRNSYINMVLVAALGLTAFYQNPVIPIASLLAACALTYVFRQVGWTRVAFNDLKNKKSMKHREFFKRYCLAFKEVFSEIYSPGPGRSARGTATSPSTRSADD
jgi:hypothetical protein